jgi:hypothetical protein
VIWPSEGRPLERKNSPRRLELRAAEEFKRDRELTPASEEAR